MLVMGLTFLVVLVFVHSRQAKDDFGPIKKPKPLMNQSEFDDFMARYIGGDNE